MILSKYKEIKEGVRNIKSWLPIIWKDRQYDYSFLLTIMIHKLILMSEFFNSDETYSADAKLYAEQIKEAGAMLNYINNSEYEGSAMEPYYKAYPSDYDISDFDSFIASVNKELTAEQKELFDKSFKDIDKKYNLAMEIFCNIFKEQLRSWWD